MDKTFEDLTLHVRQVPDGMSPLKRDQTICALALKDKLTLPEAADAFNRLCDKLDDVIAGLIAEIRP
jgi:hypothetical protein